MRYDLTEPCEKCPFRNDIRPYLTPGRVEEIVESTSFPCHKTIGHDDEGEAVENKNSQMCAGYMIMLEKMEQPSQMMRIAERLGKYDRKKLNMQSPVYEDGDEMADAQIN